MKHSIFVKTAGGSHIPTPIPPQFSNGSRPHSTAIPTTQMPQQAINLLDIEFPVFEEATQTASRILRTPICTVGIPQNDVLVLKAAIGLSQLGLMNPLARTRRLPLADPLANTVLQEKRRLILPEIAEQESFTQSSLVQEYGIQAFLGVPLLTTDGDCVGVLAAMDVEPHSFSAEAIAFMELLARWSVSEYERYQLAQKLTEPAPQPSASATEPAPLLDAVRLTLLSQLTQEMRNPLTSITGMASMLSREIYGTLTPKQREYAEIVRSSSQVLLEIANEVLELSSLEANLHPLNLASVDFEMIGQQVQKMLTPIAQKNNQEIQLTVEPGSRLWVLDRDIIRQLLYHLTFAVIGLAKEAGTVRIHGSERESCLNIIIWIAHPWLGEGLPNAAVELHQQLANAAEEAEVLSRLLAQATGRLEVAKSNGSDDQGAESAAAGKLRSRETLSLLLSRHLIERHGGTLALQGNPDLGYRFVVSIPSKGSTTLPLK